MFHQRAVDSAGTGPWCSSGCPRLHLWPLGDLTDRDKSLRDLAQVRGVSAAQRLELVLKWNNEVKHFVCKVKPSFFFLIRESICATAAGIED